MGGVAGLGNNTGGNINNVDGLTTTTTAAATVNANPNDDFTGVAQQQQDGNAINDRPQQLHQQPPRGNNNAGGVEPQNVNTGEHALFRFSTEGILPVWLPLPAFSFEVVRRPPIVPDTAAAAAPPPPGPANHTNSAANQQAAVGDRGFDQNTGAINNVQQDGVSFWRRLLQLAGTIPMSPQEEAIAADQLVDMFPQYDRADLLRELRSRRSSEAVAESILLGLFSGVPRGGAIIEGHVNMGEEEADRESNRGRPII
jgi:hypothetical protein